MEPAHAFGRQRMRLQIRIDEARRIEHAIGEPLEGVGHAFRRLPGGCQKAHARAVGLILLGAYIGEQRILDRGLRSADRRGAGLAHARVFAARGGDQRAHSQQQSNDRLGGGGGELLAQPHQMPASDMAGLVGEHADDLVRGLGLHQRAGIDEDAAPVGDKGIEGAVVDDDDLDILLGQASGLQDRLHVFAQQLLDFGIANDRRALGTGSLGRRLALGGAEGDRSQQRKRTNGPRSVPTPTPTSRGPRIARRLLAFCRC